jgi:hypothetical protein
MKHIQARVSDIEYKAFRNKAIDLGLTMEKLIKVSILEKLIKEESNEDAIETYKKILSTQYEY